MTAGGLSPQSRYIVEQALSRLAREYDVKEYPADCFRLLERIRAAGRIDLEIRTSGDFSADFDAAAVWFPETDSYMIAARPAPADWKKRSPGRRINFTLAHELGHIFCGHLRIPRGCKSEAEKERDDREADEFAARLLMPEKLVMESRPGSLSALAEAFLVSDAAAATRLKNLGGPDLFHRGGAVCPRCGNTEISPRAGYCGICGLNLREEGRDGVRTAKYESPETDGEGRVRKCPGCGNRTISGALYCRYCGTPVTNICAGDDPLRKCGAANRPDARYCERCGGRTEYMKRGLLRDWREALADWIRAAAGNAPAAPRKRKARRFAPSDSYAPAAACPECGEAAQDPGTDYCRKCGASRLNLCRPEYALAPRHTNPADARYCERCGAVTAFFNRRELSASLCEAQS